MALIEEGGTISSDRSPHTARPVPGLDRRWEVSWLPGLNLDRASAIRAIMLADISDLPEWGPEGQPACWFEDWASDIGLTAVEALVFLAEPPAWTEAGKDAEPSDPEAAE